MARTIVRRFVIGYSSMLVLMVAVSAYSIFQLEKLRDAAHIALRVEQRMIDYSEKLADSFLSEVRYAGKFSVTHTPEQYDQYKQFNLDFDRSMEQLKLLAGAHDVALRLDRVAEFHAQFRQLFAKEVDYIKTNQPYAETRYREDKDRLVDYLLREHEALKTTLQQSLQQRIRFIENAALESQKITLIATILLVGLGTGFASRLGRKMPADQTTLDTLGEPLQRLHWRLPAWWKGFGVSK
jgi:CHASE3 domain sensor protein